MTVHYADVTIDYTQVDSNLTDFVVYIDLSDMPAALHAAAADGGGEIRCFKDDGTTELAREVVSYVAASDTGELHVRFSGTLSATVDTVIEIHLDTGESDYAVTATYGRNNVWQDYAFVFHGDDLVCSTGNHTLTESGPSSQVGVAGKMGGSFDFRGANNHYYSTADAATLSFTDAITISCWALCRDDTRGQLFGKYDTVTTGREYFIETQQSATTAQAMNLGDTNGGGFKATSADNLNDVANDTWSHTVGTWDKDLDSGLGQIFVDGLEVTVYSNQNAKTTALGNMTTSFRVGHVYSTNRALDGQIDEMRGRGEKLSAAWIDAEYTNQNTPSTFYAATAVSASGDFIQSIAGHGGIAGLGGNAGRAGGIAG